MRLKWEENRIGCAGSIPDISEPQDALLHSCYAECKIRRHHWCSGLANLTEAAP